MEQPQITVEQAFANMEEVIRYSMAAGIFKTFPELDAARVSLQIINNAYQLLKNKADGNEKEKIE